MIFVTGGTGLVGAHLLYGLTRNGKKVKALKRKTSQVRQVLKTFSFYTSDAQKLFDSIEWVDGDILDYFSLEKILQGVEEIYHCAAIVSFVTKDRRKIISNNVEGTANLIDAALENGVKKICHVSSVAALGNYSYGEPVTEETNWIPGKKHSAYSQSKFFSEVEIWRGIEEGLDAIIVNPSIILGPGNWETSSPRLFKTIWEGLKFYTRGVTGYVDVNDVVRAMLQLMDETNFSKCKNQRFLLNAENLGYEKVFHQIADSLGKPAPSVYASPLMTGIAWRVAAFSALITGKTPAITKDVVSSSHSISHYDGSKITNAIGLKYIPIKDSIKNTSLIFTNDIK